MSSGSPGATLLSNYGLRQVPCGPSGLVVIYGPNLGIICAYPNGLVAAGNYAVRLNAEGLDGKSEEKTFSISVSGSVIIPSPRRYSEPHE